jgi:hypothetical protein
LTKPTIAFILGSLAVRIGLDEIPRESLETARSKASDSDLTGQLQTQIASHPAS